jgi:ParB family chromosome partitioning protein
MKKRGLGRNLNVLLSRTPSIETEVRTLTQQEGDLRHLPIETLQRGRYQPRKEIAQGALQELADSIRAQGIIQPIVVRALSANRYEIIAGERRWRAAQLAALSTVPVLIKNIPDEAALAIALIENIQRENLNPIEEALALQRLIDEFSMTHAQVAEVVGKSRATISNLLRLLSLQPTVRTLLEQGKIEMGHARALLALSAVMQIELARKVAEKNLSVRETEHLVNQWQSDGAKPSAPFRKLDPDIQRLQQKLSEQIGAPVIFKHGSRGKGKMIIHYSNLDELEGILAKIK